MRDTLTDSTLLVATTHLKAKASPENEQIRICQARQLVDGLSSLLSQSGSGGGAVKGPLSSKTYGAPHIVLTGDFNTTMDSEVCQILKSEGLASMWDGELIPESSLPAGGGGGAKGRPDEEFTTWKFRESNGCEAEVKRVIDYIWFSQGLNLMSRWAQLSEADIGNTGLPSMTYPSDHIAICCDLDLPQ
mmetsp:Transcript_15960/g.44551  ORF Transcript_15960/g.44551 Transcript_15960/m.44551 type:complete len:189 (+) Transcript_15960:130-696(+)